jgi:hypothetical protein
VSAAAGAALLIGLFGVPTALLAMGHRLRERSRTVRGAFWGGVIGHTTALAVAVLAFHVPPVLWQHDARTFLVLWLMPLAGAAGALAGAATARGRAPG